MPDTLPERAEVDAAVATHREGRRRLQATTDALADAREVASTARIELEASMAAAEDVDAAAIEVVRGQREDAWRRHMQILHVDTAAAFETEMRVLDRMMAAAPEGAVRRNVRDASRKAFARAMAACTRSESDVQSATHDMDLAAAGLSEMALRLALPPASPPEALRPRLDAALDAARLRPAATHLGKALAGSEAKQVLCLDRLRKRPA